MPTALSELTDDRPCVVVAVLTYRRPQSIQTILPHLIEQSENSPADTRVVVVDNDPNGSARETVAPWIDRVTYLHEPRPGIAAARNAALDEASGADAVVFIDDDEVPAQGWLDRLITAWRSWGCAAVVGPVVSLFETSVEPWITESGMFARPRRETGFVMRGAATNNLLLDLRVLDTAQLRFDDAFGLTGGSDTMLTHDLVARGFEIRWCDEAEVTTVIPDDRSTRDYVLRRNFRTGTTWSRVKLELAQGSRPVRRADLATRAVVRISRGCAQYAWGRVTGSVGDQARGACGAAAASGMLLGALGYRYAEYARPAVRVHEPV